jgi:quercetin dioxygenase-like cupin family protein
MDSEARSPRIFRTLHSEALEIKRTPFGSVGRVFSGEGIEAVWVCKQAEAIDPDWFSQSTADLLLVVSGRLRVEFEQPDQAPRTLEPGDLLVLPAHTRCRAYRWPRDSQEPAIFLAVYPVDASSSHASVVHA